MSKPATSEKTYDELLMAARQSYAAGKPDDAYYICCIAMKRPEAERIIKLLFAQTFPETKIRSFNPDVKNAIYMTLTEEGIEYQKLMPAWFNIMQYDPDFTLLFSFMNKKEKLKIEEWEKIYPVLSDDFFVEGIRKFTLTNLVLENILTYFRAQLLLTLWPAGVLKLKHLGFICALAEQCYMNEYLFHLTEDEQEALESLPMDDAVATSIRACYQKIDALNIDEKACAMAPFRRMIDFMVKAPRERLKIREHIPVITPIQNAVTESVRDMYEENPYPYWRYQDVPMEPYNDFTGSILVAGCGTGKFATYLGQILPNSSITCIDISLASMSYAKQKAAEYGVCNSEFYQCDIYDVAKLGKKFDYINCGGVLHHMDDPVRGWQCLIDVLKSGGLMYISLYSQLARKSQQKARDFAFEKKFPSTPDGIRAFRRAFLKSFPDQDILSMIKWKDFFTVSEVRDLVFHVQEKAYTILELQGVMDSLELEFLRFEMPGVVTKNEYLKRFPDNPLMNNIDYWNQMEQDFPDIFAHMYSMKCKRRGENLSDHVKILMNLGV